MSAARLMEEARKSSKWKGSIYSSNIEQLTSFSMYSDPSNVDLEEDTQSYGSKGSQMRKTMNQLNKKSSRIIAQTKEVKPRFFPQINVNMMPHQGC